MKQTLISAFLIAVIALCLTPSHSSAQSPKTLLEQRVFYQFDPAHANPKAVDKRLSEARFKGLVLWVGQPKPGKPTIFYLPGSQGNLAVRGRKFPWFLDRGYGVVAMAYPGMNGSKGRPSQKRIQGLANQLYQSLPKFVGDSPVVIWGESLGTGVGLEIAAHSVARKRPPLGIVLQAPYTSLLDLVAYKRPLMVPFFADRTDLWPSKRTIRRTKAPLFIMHGGKDKTIPIAMGKTLFKLSPSRNKVFVTYPDAAHTSIWRRDAVARMYNWIEALY